MGGGTSGCLPGLPQTGGPLPPYCRAGELASAARGGQQLPSSWIRTCGWREVFKRLMTLINTGWDLGR